MLDGGLAYRRSRVARSLAGDQQAVRNVFVLNTIGLHRQQERLRTDTVHRLIEIRELQPGEFQPRLVDDMPSLGSPTNTCPNSASARRAIGTHATAR
jgi:hypothetical protein